MSELNKEYQVRVEAAMMNAVREVSRQPDGIPYLLTGEVCEACVNIMSLMAALSPYATVNARQTKLFADAMAKKLRQRIPLIADVLKTDPPGDLTIVGEKDIQ